jgi:GTPase SAR1 family protein
VIPFVLYDEKLAQFRFENRALDIFKNNLNKIAVMTIAGLRATGKTSLLNELIQ